VNAKFFETLKTRSNINDGDRASVRKLFEDLLAVNSPPKPGDPPPTPEEADDAEFKVLEQYFKEQERLDQLREEFPLPDPTKC
jgi:hypothetical protein